jgi:hypothetical protein
MDPDADPDPAIFVNDLQDTNKRIRNLISNTVMNENLFQCIGAVNERTKVKLT